MYVLHMYVRSYGRCIKLWLQLRYHSAGCHGDEGQCYLEPGLVVSECDIVRIANNWLTEPKCDRHDIRVSVSVVKGTRKRFCVNRSIVLGTD